MDINKKTTHHSRSKSSPIELHPFLSQFNQQLRRLQSSQGASTSRVLITHKLTSLIELHDCVVSRLSCIQSGVPKEHNEKLVGTLLDGSLWLIDVCGTISDVLMQAKEGTRKLQSVLRRRRGKYEIVANEIGEYFISRKIVRKVITKSLRDSKSYRKKFNLHSSNKNLETISFLSILEDSQLMSIDVFDSLLAYVDGTRTSKWSLVSKLVNSKEVTPEAEDCSLRNKFEVVDAALHMLMSQKTAKCINSLQIEKLRCHLEELESLAIDLGRSIESLSRLLIKSRVALLNILHC